MGVLSIAQWLGEVLRAVPGPTEQRASIIGSLAWPVVTVYLVARYRAYIRSFLDTIATRLRTDHVKIGPFAMTPNSEVIALDAERVDESIEDYAPEDVDRIERLYEFIAEPSNYARLTQWMNETLPQTFEVWEFLGDPDYAIERKLAFEALVEEDEE